mgnify:CR=1 FL=1
MMETATSCTPMKPKDYKSGVKPVWCPGCGDFSVLMALTKALAEMRLAAEQVALISGIGCSSRLPAYLNVYGFHSVHGRALPVATGLKIARPDLTVLAAGGDGDGFSIGGNHFMHSCRRNVDITYIVMDNQVYGMTKGQASPTTDPDWDHSKLTPGGTKVNPYYPLVIALASGANFIARASSSDPNGAAKVIVDAIRHPGFSFVHILSPCITFRPEQRDWKKMVRPAPVEATSNPVTAAHRLMTDDNFFLGTLYKGNRPPYQPDLTPVIDDLSSIEKDFEL